MPGPTTNSALAPRVDAATQKIPVWLYPALFAASLAAYWAPRIFRGFWVDEAGTYWMVHEGWRSVWHQLSIVPSESIIYGYIAALFASAGDEKELLLRLPSVAAMLVSAFVVYKLSERIAGLGLDASLQRSKPVGQLVAAETLIDVPEGWQPPAEG